MIAGERSETMALRRVHKVEVASGVFQQQQFALSLSVPARLSPTRAERIGLSASNVIPNRGPHEMYKYSGHPEMSVRIQRLGEVRR